MQLARPTYLKTAAKNKNPKPENDQIKRRSQTKKQSSNQETHKMTKS